MPNWSRKGRATSPPPSKPPPTGLQLRVRAANLRRLSCRAKGPKVVRMRRPVVAGNWKMHGSRSVNGTLLTELERRLNSEWPIDVVVFPPFVYLSDAARLLE